MFLSPALLGFLALAAAPIIIHLLNRRRFVRVDWAPMRVLRQTVASNRRRVRLEQWLLLLLRTLAVAALIVAVARPMLSGSAMSLFERAGRASRVVVVDDSLGMGGRSDGSTAYGRAADAAAALLEQIGPDDEVTVLRTSAPGRPLVTHARLESPDAVLASLREAGPTDVGSNWAATMAAVDRLLGGATYPVREVTLITDLAPHGWDEGVTRTAAAWAAADVSLRVLDVGRDVPGGLSVAAIRPRDPVTLVDVNTAVLVDIANDGGEPAGGATLSVTVDGVDRTVDLPEVPAGDRVSVPVEVAVSEAGPHRVSVRLPPDALDADGRGFLILEVRPELDVVLVDGQPGVEPFEGETDFLRLALTAGYSRVKVRTLLPADWEAAPIVAADLVVLAGVDRFPPARVDELEQLVAGGTGLMVFAGSSVSPDAVNEQLLAGGEGLLPVRVGEPVEVDESAAGLVLGDVAGSPLEALGRLSSRRLATVKPRIVMPAAVPQGSEARVLARWNDGPQTPAVVSGPYGRGGVMFWSVSADRDWSDWPTDPTYVLAVRAAALALAGRSGDDRPLTAGDPLRVPLAADRRPQDVTVTAPDARDLSADILEAEGRLVAQTADTADAGFYEAAWQEPAGDRRTVDFAVNPDVADAARGKVEASELARLLGPLAAEVVPWTGGVTAEAGRNELWRYVVAAVILLLLSETALAAWVDRNRAPGVRTTRV